MTAKYARDTVPRRIQLRSHVSTMIVNFYVAYDYITDLTQGQMASNPDAIDDWELFEVDMTYMLKAARAKDDEALLRLIIDSLVADPAGRVDEFAGQVYGFCEEQMVELLTHAFHFLWPDAVLSRAGEGPKVEFQPMSDAEWAARRGR
ncbi:MAG: hypothetical protein AB8H80_04875 [Planctomycetota bacterium]